MIGPMNPRITIGFRGSPDPGSGAPRPRIRGPGPWPQNGTPFWTHFWLILGASPEAPLSRFWPGSPVLTVDSAQELFRTCSGRALKMTPYFGPFLRPILRPPGPKWAPKWASFLCVQPGSLKCTSPVGALPGPSQGPYLDPYFEGSWGLTHVQPHLSWPKGPQNRAQNRASRGPYRPIWAPILGPILEGSWGLGPVQPHLSPPKGPQNRPQNRPILGAKRPSQGPPRAPEAL